MWPVLLTPLNLPPWECVNPANFFMSLLIPGPKSPGKDFDVFLEPLIEELLELWKGVSTYDACTGRKFDLRAVVLWCIHDFFPSVGHFVWANNKRGLCMYLVRQGSVVSGNKE
jgi:hypothetical protein